MAPQAVSAADSAGVKVMDGPQEIQYDVTDCHPYAGLGTNDLAGRQTILLVEDEDFVRGVAGEILRDAGYRVIAAKRSSEALLSYKQQQVELLLTDVVLPGEDGRILAQKIRRTNPSIKVLLMTGYAEQMGADLTEQEGFLSKPFASGELLGRVARLLGPVGAGEGATEEVRPDKAETGEIGAERVRMERNFD